MGMLSKGKWIQGEALVGLHDMLWTELSLSIFAACSWQRLHGRMTIACNKKRQSRWKRRNLFTTTTMRLLFLAKKYSKCSKIPKGFSFMYCKSHLICVWIHSLWGTQVLRFLVYSLFLHLALVLFRVHTHTHTYSHLVRWRLITSSKCHLAHTS